ncbi:hypothetical protein [Profundibacter sp.]
MKHFAILPALALIAACATPQEQCINTASNEVRNIRTGISTAQGNIARGYAIFKSRESYEVVDVCYDKDKKPYTCYNTEYRTIESPVSINVAEERRKLANLKKRLPAATRLMNKSVASCRVQFPE